MAQATTREKYLHRRHEQRARKAFKAAMRDFKAGRIKDEPTRLLAHWMDKTREG